MDELVNGAVTRTFTYGLRPISENQLINGTWTPTFYGHDGHGNVRFLTSSAGTVGNTYQFDAFGMLVASTGTTLNTYLYSGERFDTGLNLYHLRARYYNQATGRFETMDPYQGKISNPGTLHKYVFTGNNPVNWVDPSGNDIEEYAELLHFTFEQIHTFHFAHGIGGCVQGTLALTNNALASLTGGETVEPDEEFPDCITRALWNPLQPAPYLPFPPYPPDWPYWPYQ